MFVCLLVGSFLLPCCIIWATERNHVTFFSSDVTWLCVTLCSCTLLYIVLLPDTHIFVCMCWYSNSLSVCLFVSVSLSVSLELLPSSLCLIYLCYPTFTQHIVIEPVYLKFHFYLNSNCICPSHFRSVPFFYHRL